ncbi:MAG: Txe/YoeB family addiction module toxin [candidate division Zixibacteria bacterium]|nr:Txe/YoeB family addiction module toxin [Candidatus Tariuqbacter arcticus]
MKKVVFLKHSFEDFNYWAETDLKTYRKIINLIRDISRSPFSGIGKPEHLKYQYKGCWSRRIDNIHRLIYQATDDEIIIVACRYHYQ